MKHLEALGDKWHTLLPDPQKAMPGLVATVLSKGGTRDVWRTESESGESTLIVWPAEEPFRAGVLMHGPKGGELKPVTATPFMEGLPNLLTIEEAHPWFNKREGEFAGTRGPGKAPLWFYNPLFERDAPQCAQGSTHNFELSALAMALRPALIDEMTISSGPQYEAYAAHWLEENPGKTRLDVPQLKFPLKGARILTPTDHCSTYQVRVPITSVQTTLFGGVQVHMLHIQFGMDDPEPLDIMLYAPASICKDGYEPKDGDEIDIIMWLQGRIAD